MLQESQPRSYAAQRIPSKWQVSVHCSLRYCGTAISYKFGLDILFTCSSNSAMREYDRCSESGSCSKTAIRINACIEHYCLRERAKPHLHGALLGMPPKAPVFSSAPPPGLSSVAVPPVLSAKANYRSTSQSLFHHDTAMAWAEKDLSSLKGGGGRRGDVVSGYFHPNHQQAHKVKRGREGKGRKGKGRRGKRKRGHGVKGKQESKGRKRGRQRSMPGEEEKPFLLDALDDLSALAPEIV